MSAPSSAAGEELGLQLLADDPAGHRSGLAAAAIATIEQHAQWPVLARLPMLLTASVPVPRFKVRDLLGLRAGKVLHTAWPSTADIPLAVGDTRLSWTEFEVVEQQLAVRLTRLA